MYHRYNSRVRRRDEAAEPFVWADGVRVADTTIWCDAPRLHAVSFVSHAGVRVWRRRARPGTRVVASEPTVRIARALGAQVADVDVLTPRFGRPFALGRLRLELLPSGRAPGAAQLSVQRDGRTVVYAGELNPTPGRTVEKPQVRACEAIALAAPLAPYLRALPARHECEAQLIATIDRALSDGKTALVLTSVLGSAGEIAALLDGRALRIEAHRRIQRVLAACGQQVSSLRRTPGPRVILWPLELHASPALARVPDVTRILVSGHALDAEAARRVRADDAVALADHGDLPSLLEHVRESGARDVYFSAGLTDEVAQAFRKRRLRVHALCAPAQLGLFPAPAGRHA